MSETGRNAMKNFAISSATLIFTIFLLLPKLLRYMDGPFIIHHIIQHCNSELDGIKRFTELH